MTCYAPIKAYKSLTRKSESGKSVIAFKPQDAGLEYELIELPCGQCIGCRLARSKDWAVRCMHEASLFRNNCFITLTYNNENIPSNGSLRKSDFVKFMKRLRKRFSGLEAVADEDSTITFPIRFFHCGEYGSQLSRPHHHAILFNFDFPDKYLLSSSSSSCPLFTSEVLEELWSKEILPETYHCYESGTVFESSGKYYAKLGYVAIGDVSVESCAYVARYITKKINGDQGANHYVRIDEATGELYYLEPEYITMSRRPGIANRWFKLFGKDDVYSKDFISLGGKKFRPPRYYDKMFDICRPEILAEIKQKRLDKMRDNPDNTFQRRFARMSVQTAKAKRLVRSYENANVNV